MGGTLRHPPATATGTLRPPFTRKRHQVLPRATLTPKPRHAVLDHAARQEFPELALDELWQARPVVGLRRRAQEGLQVLGDDLMEHGVRRPPQVSVPSGRQPAHGLKIYVHVGTRA